MSDYEKIVEALESAEVALIGYRSMPELKLVQKALPLASELVKYKEGLEWMVMKFHKNGVLRYLLADKDCPVIIKRMIGEKQ